jgi:hypothetical protein
MALGCRGGSGSPGDGNGAPRGRAADPRGRGRRRSLTRDGLGTGQPSSMRCAQPCSQFGSASSPGFSRRARRHLPRRPPPRLGMPRTDTRRCRCATTTSAQGRVLPHRHHQSAEVLAFYRARRGRPRRRAALVEKPSPTPARARESFATMCEWRSGSPGGWSSARTSGRRSSISARWDGRGFPDIPGDALRCHASCTWRGNLALPHGLKVIEARATIERRAGAYDPRLAGLATPRRPARGSGRDPDVGQAVRSSRFRSVGLRAHRSTLRSRRSQPDRPQVTVAA